MAGKVIAVANSKGGVGKTTTTVSIAEAFAAVGLKTLVLDLDFQANASLLVMGDQGDEKLYRLISKRSTLADYLEQNLLGGDPTPLSKVILKGASDVTHKGHPLALDLGAATSGLRIIEREMIYTFTDQGFAMRAIEGKVRNLFKSDLDRVRKDYDIIVVDCPPGISAMTEAVLTTSDLIVVPTIPDFLSTLGVDLFCGDIIKSLRKHGLKHNPVVLATKFDASPNQTIVLKAMIENSEAENAAFSMFETIVPNRPEFAIDPFMIGPSPTLAQKWSGDALSTINTLYLELKEMLQ
ncbi:MAG: AAA family ATPase [Pseudomonadota bacterium]